MSDPKTIDPYFIGYTAGFIDGEGCIGLYGGATSEFVLTLTVGQKDIEPLLLLEKVWGGTVVNRRGDRTTPDGKLHNAYDFPTWRTNSRIAARVLQVICPHLVVKKKKATIALLFQQSIADLPNFSFIGIPQEVRLFRQMCKAAIQDPDLDDDLCTAMQRELQELLLKHIVAEQTVKLYE